MTSASDAPAESAIGWRAESTRLKRAGSLPAQSFCGARRMREPFAPPRLSDPRNVRALSQAVATSSATVKSVAAIFAFTSSTLYFEFPAGIGSCQIKSSAGTSGPT